MPSRSSSSLTLDVDGRCLLRDGQRIPLSPKDFALLRYLVAHPGRVIPHAELLEAVWGDSSVVPEVLKVRIARLRRLLDDDSRRPRFIQNVHGDGYRFLPQPTIDSRGVGRSTDDDPVASIDTVYQTDLVDRDATFELKFPVVGRQAELARLDDLLTRVAGGRRQIVLVAGEPGIGKTTLIDLFVAQVERRDDTGDDRHTLAVSTPAMRGPSATTIARGQCIEHYGRGEPYLPVMEALGRLGRADRENRALKVALRQYAPSWLIQLPALLAPDEQEALQRQAVAPSRERMVRELAEALEALTTAAPTSRVLIVVIEDLHWADPSTLDLLTLLAKRRDPARLLVVGSYRPVEIAGGDHPLRRWLHDLRTHDTIAELMLGPLAERDVTDYIGARFPGGGVPSSLATHLHRRSEGNPLFLADLVRDLLARRVILDSNGMWTLHGDVDMVTWMMPGSLRQLMARQRDRLDAQQRRLLEAASIAGLEFSAAAVAAALQIAPADAEDRCLDLAEQQQFLRVAGIEEWPDGTRTTRFGFLHALHRELWLERISAARAPERHLRIAKRKEAAFKERAGEIASELAVHFERAYDFGRAITYYHLAGENALRRAANAEAHVHIETALSLLDRLPDDRERDRHELQLQIVLATLLAMRHGVGSAAAAQAFERARQICLQLHDARDVFPPVFGLLRAFWSRGDLAAARELGTQLVRIAEKEMDPTLHMVACCAFGAVLFNTGEVRDSIRFLDEALSLGRTYWRDSLLPAYGIPIDIVAWGTAISVLEVLGYPDRALSYARTTLQMASTREHPFARAAAHHGLCHFHQLRRDFDTLLRMTDRLEDTTSKFAGAAIQFGIFVDLYRGWAWTMLGRGADGLSPLQRALDVLTAAGLHLFVPQALYLLAEAYQILGRPVDARDAIDRALGQVAGRGWYWLDPEMHRIRGELEADVDAAEASFQRATALARERHMKLFELRATLSLARLWRHTGRDAEARDAVQSICDRFTEDCDTPDLLQARTFLATPRATDAGAHLG